MTRIASILFLTLLLMGCSNSSIEGTYIKVKENDRGSDLNFLGLSIVKEITFGDKMCHFDYFGTKMGGEYSIDGKYVYIAVGGELGTLTMEIINDDILEGEGWISGTFKKQ